MSQVLQILRDDFLRMKWGYLAYLIIAAATTVFKLEENTVPSSALESFLGITLYVLVLVLYALPITRDTRIAASKDPNIVRTDPKAAFPARLIQVLLLTAPLVPGQILLLAKLQVPANEIPGLIAESVLLFSLVLLSIGVIATLTLGIGWIVLTLIFLSMAASGLALALVLYVGQPSESSGPVSWQTLIYSSAFFIACCIGLMLHQYRTRRLAVGIILSCIAYGAFRILPSFAAPLATTRPINQAFLSDSLRPAELRLASYPLQPYTNKMERGWLTMDAGLSLTPRNPQYRYVFWPTRMRLRSEDGASSAVTPNAHGTVLFEPVIQLGDTLSWLFEPTHRQYTHNLEFYVTRSQRKFLENGSATLEIEGYVEAFRPTLFSISRERNSARLITGARTWIGTAGDIINRQGMFVMTSAAGSMAERFYLKQNGWHRFALVNTRRAEAAALQNSVFDATSGFLLLPLAKSVLHQTALFPEEEETLQALRKAGQGWIDESKLTGVDWISLGSYPVKIEGTVTLQLARR